MSRRALIWTASAATVALVATLVAVLTVPIVDGGGATTALPGVPPSELRQQQIEVELVHPSGFQVPRDYAEQMTGIWVRGAREIAQTIPVRLRSERYPVFDGLAWAVVIDPSSAPAYPPISVICCPLAGVSPDDDYFVALFDAECGHFLRVVAPGYDYDVGPTPNPLDSDREKRWTPYCPDIWD